MRGRDHSGVDLRRGLALFSGDRALYLKYLRAFLEDESLRELEKAFSRGDLEAAYLHAHAFKGLSAQLGLPSVAEPASALCRLLLGGGSPAAARAALFRLAASCKAARFQIRRLIRKEAL